MKTNSDFSDLLRALVEEKARFLVVGAYAVIHHTEPRYTKDLDVWVDPTRRNASRVRRALGTFGAPVATLTVEDLCTPETVFQIGVAPVRVDILTTVPGLTFAAAFARAEVGKYADVPIRVLSLADTLCAKEIAGRPQDKLDARRLRKARDKRLPPRK